MGQHREIVPSSTHTAFRYVVADVSSVGTEEAKPQATSAVGLIGLQEDLRRVRYLVDPATPTWGTLYPGFTATGSAPTVNEDTNGGYEPGHIWVDTSGGNSYICRDAAAGAAVWDQINGGGAVSLDSAYDGGATITVDAGPVTLDADVADATAALAVTREPGAGAASVGLSVVMGANATGDAVTVAHNGSGFAFRATAGQFGGGVNVATPAYAQGSDPDTGFGFNDIAVNGVNSPVVVVAGDAKIRVDTNFVNVYEPLDVTAPAVAGAAFQSFGITAPAHTSLPADAEYADVRFNLARTITFTAGTGIALNRSVLIQPPTIDATAPETITEATTVEITGPPVAAGNMTITTPWSLRLGGGAMGGPDGTAARPTYGFTAEPGSGMYRTAGGAVGFSQGGTLRAYIDATALTLNNIDLHVGTNQVWFDTAGTAGDTRIYSAVPDRINLMTGTFTRLSVDNNEIITGRHLVPSSANTYNLGRSTKYLHLGLDGGINFNENASIPGTLAPAAGEGALWVRNDTPNVLIFTDNAGTDWVLNTAAGGNTLDGAYDQGGAGAGRTITVDAGAVTLDADSNDTTAALSVTREPTVSSAAVGVSVTVGANSTGPLFSLSNSGTGSDFSKGSEFTFDNDINVGLGQKFLLDGSDTGLQVPAVAGRWQLGNLAGGGEFSYNGVQIVTRKAIIGNTDNTFDLGTNGIRWRVNYNRQVDVSRTTADATAALIVDRSPSASAAAVGLNLTMGANATGDAISITNNGTGTMLNGLDIENDGTITTLRPASGDYLRVGDANTTSHSLSSNDDLLVSGILEVNGITYCDSNLNVGGTLSGGIISATSYLQATDGAEIYVGSGFDAGFTYQGTNDLPVVFTGSKNVWILAEKADRDFNFGWATQTNPTLAVHSANQSTTEHLSLYHDQTDGNIDTGAGNLNLTPTGGEVIVTGDIDADGGMRRVFTAWIDNITASETRTATLNGAGGNDVLGWFVCPRAGSIVELAAAVGSDRTAGDLQIWVQKSTDGGDTFSDVWGTSTTGAIAIDATNPERHQATQAKDTDTFAAGDILRVRAEGSPTWAPTADLICHLGIEY